MIEGDTVAALAERGAAVSDRGYNDSRVADAMRRELRDWAWLAVGALAVAGVFALLLALSRVPGMEKTPLWPIDFFYKGLVIHVVFSLVIWLLAVFAFLVSVATLRAAGEGRASRTCARRRSAGSGRASC